MNRASAFRSAASRMPGALIHIAGNIASGSARNCLQRLARPHAALLARLPQHRRIVEASDRPRPCGRSGRRGSGRASTLRGGIERMAGAAGLEQRCCRLPRQRDRDSERERAAAPATIRDHAGGGSVSIITSRLVPDSPPQAWPGLPSIWRTLAFGLSLGNDVELLGHRDRSARSRCRRNR